MWLPKTPQTRVVVLLNGTIGGHKNCSNLDDEPWSQRATTTYTHAKIRTVDYIHGDAESNTHCTNIWETHMIR